MKHGVYRYYGKAGELLYVGCSMHPIARLINRSYRPWLLKVVLVKIVYYRTKCKALCVERNGIKNENPLYNKRWEDGRDRWGKKLRTKPQGKLKADKK